MISKKKIKLFANDVIFNTFSFSILTISQQLFALPLISKNVTDEVFGQCLTLIAAINILSIIFGENVGNSRLITKINYEKFNYNGDYKVLLTFGCIGSSILITLFYLFITNDMVLFHLILLITIMIMSTLRLYLVAEYRMKKEFKNILTQNVVYFSGLSLGILIFIYINNWIIVFFIAELSAVFFSIRKSSIKKDLFKKTPLYIQSLMTWVKLGSNAGITSTISYIDRLLIFPILGPASVSIYFASSIVAKIGVLIVNPLNGVLLSWFSDISKNNVTKMLKVIFLASSVIGCLYFVLILNLSPIALKLIYPEFFPEGEKLILWISIASSISIITSILKPFLIRFGNLQNLIVINITYGIVFVALGVLFSRTYGLIGFAFSAIISQGLLLILMVSSALLNIYFNKSYRVES